MMKTEISDHQQSWGYEDGPWKGPGPPLLVAADLIHKPPASIRFAPIKHALAVTVEPFKFSPRQGGDFLRSNNLTFFVLVIKNWCLCPSLINIFGKI